MNHTLALPPFQRFARRLATFLRLTVKPSLKPLLLFPVLILAAGCATHDDDNDFSAHPIGRHVTRMNGEPSMFDVQENDADMDHATRRARETVGRFIAALQHPTPTQRDFQVNKLCIKGDHGEHIWLADVKFTGNRFVGSVDNRPAHLPGLKVGARVAVNPDEISDWSYVDNGQLVGGYTIRVLYSELTPQERADFEKQADFHLGPRKP